VVAVVSFAVFAVLVARLARAPRAVTNGIVGVALAVLLASQFLPAGHPFRADVAQSTGNLAWLALALLPLAGYALVLRRLRRRTGVAEIRDRSAQADHPVGLVQIDDDAALAADTAAALGLETAARLDPAPHATSLGWRTADGALAGHLRLRWILETGEIEMLWVAAAHRRQGIARRLLTAADGLARERGTRRLAARVGSWQGWQALAAAGFATTSEVPLGGGQRWLWMERGLA
jgi:GNAT superfamily N-acetyltransferase